MNLINNIPSINAKAISNAQQHLIDKGLIRSEFAKDSAFRIVDSFAQMWGSTALGFSGRIGGAAMTNALTTVMVHLPSGIYVIAFNGQAAYHVVSPTDCFWADVYKQSMASTRGSSAYKGLCLSEERVKVIAKDIVDCSDFVFNYSKVNESAQERLEPELKEHFSKLTHTAAELSLSIKSDN